MIETSGVIEKEQGNGFYLVTLEQPAGHQCLCRAAGKLTKFRIKLLAGDKVLVEISPYDLTRGRITYRERNAGATGPRPAGTGPEGPGAAEAARSESGDPRRQANGWLVGVALRGPATDALSFRAGDWPVISRG
jgi:translation initiation factor IF-1